MTPRQYTRDQAQDLIEKASEYLEYGPDYCRHVAAAAADVVDALTRGRGVSTFAAVLDVRLGGKLRDRDGLQIAPADRVELVDPDTGETLARGVVTVIEGPRKCKVRWDGAPKDSRELGDEICVVAP